MLKPVFALILCGAVPTIGAGAQASGGTELSQIKQRVSENLSRLPNYTCRQTIERSVQKAESRRYVPMDRLRLEVAYVGGKELFAWPGASRFEEKRIEQLVGGGAIGNGQFGGHVEAIFRGPGATFKRDGDTSLNGRKAIRYEYSVPREKSEFVVSTEFGGAVVGYHGSFWVEAGTLDLLRLDVQTDQIPPHVQLTSDTNVMEYARLPIGESDFLLPKFSELRMTQPDGAVSRNRVSFDGCRQYMGESVIRFDEDTSGTAAAAVKSIPVSLAGGLEVEAALRTKIDMETGAVGDPVSVELLSPIRGRDGGVLAPKGALLTGRISRLGRRFAVFGDFYVVGILLTGISSGNRKGEFAADLQEVGIATNQYFVPTAFPSGPSIWSHLPESRIAALERGEGVFLIRNARAITGVRMRWRTLDPLSSK